MRKTPFLGICLAFAFTLAGCDSQPIEPTALTTSAAAPGPALSLQAESQGYGLSRDQIQLPPSARFADLPLADAINRAINPADYVCPPSTPVVDWFLTEVNKVITQEPAIFNLLYNQLLADLIPTYEAFLFQTNATPQYIGYNGEYTQILTKTEKDVKRFWDIFSADIQLIGMHGTVLLDLQRTAATYQAAFGVDQATANFFATLVRNALLQSQTLNGGNHPLFSFNAFAISTSGGPIPDKIVMGDGILAGYEAVGFADVAPQAVYAHEFAHHIQIENGYFNDPAATTGSAAEQTRYTELMADAYSAYFLTHKRGAAMNQKRVVQFLEVFFEIGDCAFTNPGHHGTPNQRMAAAQFGFDLADAAQKQGHILTSDQFHTLFLAAYPGLIAPDAP